LAKKKTIFEATPETGCNFAWYYLLSFVAFAGFLYKLNQADGTILTLGGLLGVSLASCRRASTLYSIFKFPYLSKVNLHKDGKTIDLIIRQRAQLNLVENVGIPDFKLHRGDFNFTPNVPETDDPDAEAPGKLSELRRSGIANDSWLASYGEKKLVFVPHSHTGSHSILASIFNGQPLPQKLLQ